MATNGTIICNSVFEIETNAFSPPNVGASMKVNTIPVKLIETVNTNFNDLAVAVMIDLFCVNSTISIIKKHNTVTIIQMLLWIVKNINPVHQFALNAPLTTVNCTIKPTIPDTNNSDFIKMLLYKLILPLFVIMALCNTWLIAINAYMIPIGIKMKIRAKTISVNS